MKKLVALIVALIMIVPMSVKAQEVPSIELIEEDYDGVVLSGPYNTMIEWTTVGYKPKELSVEQQSKSFAVYADITTSARRVEMQYSRDPNFKRGVKTAKFRNLKHKGPVLAFIASDGARVGNKWYFNDSIVLKQNGNSLTSRRKRVGEWDRLTATQKDVNTARKKIRCIKRMYVPNVLNPTGMYVRLRCVYDGNTNKTVYSDWSRIIKVR